MPEDYESIESDVLVIGAGGAGLRAAIAINDSGQKVIVVSKSLLGKAHTVMAEGGVAASLGNVDPQDNWTVHYGDIIEEGVYISSWKMAEILAKEAPSRVLELESYGALFDRTPDGRIMQRAFGAHTYRRLAHLGDRTGLELIKTLEHQVIHRDITFYDEMYITNLIREGNRIVGAVGIKMNTGKIFLFKGICHCYWRFRKSFQDHIKFMGIHRGRHWHGIQGRSQAEGHGNDPVPPHWNGLSAWSQGPSGY